MDAEQLHQCCQAVTQREEEARRLTAQARRVLAAAEQRLRRSARRARPASTATSGAAKV